MKHGIKAILFDSGKVLNAPKSGHWFISPEFFHIIDIENFNRIPKEKRDNAFKCANNYINSKSLIISEEEELEHFNRFYSIFAENLPELQLNSVHINKLAYDLVYNYNKYFFYDDALKVIPKLYTKYKLGIVSDAWPSLLGVYKKADLYKYFSTFVISSVIGTSKPDKLMYQTALKELNLLEKEVIFIDDNVKNCLGAEKLGISSVLLCRNKKYYCFQKICSLWNKYYVVHNLNQIEKLIERRKNI